MVGDMCRLGGLGSVLLPDGRGTVPVPMVPGAEHPCNAKATAHSLPYTNPTVALGRPFLPASLESQPP